MRREKAPAVFLENISDPRLMKRIGQESGAKIGGALFSDSLSPPDGPAPTYILMMEHNISELKKALAPAQ
jgi:zinc/manganese transport system substrate-binding protein